MDGRMEVFKVEEIKKKTPTLILVLLKKMLINDY